MRDCICFVVTICILFGCALSSALSEEEKKTLIVGGDFNFPPFEFLEDGKPTGFNIDLIRAAAKVVGLKTDIRLSSWSDARYALTTGEVDVLSGMAYSLKREHQLDFSVPHSMISPALYVRNDSPVRTMADLAGKEIVVQKGDIMHEFLMEWNQALNIIPVNNHREALQNLSSGLYDGAFIFAEVHQYFLSEKSELRNIREVDVGLKPMDYCFAALEVNRALLYQLDRGLVTLKSTGEYQKIYNRWFGIYEHKRFWATVVHFILAIGVVGVFFIVSLIWSWTLRQRVEKKTRELQVSEEQLREAQTKLEQRVEERTRDLASANRKLISEIHERKKIEFALRENEEKYRAIVDGFEGYIYICSSEYRIEFMNNSLINNIGKDGTGDICYVTIFGLEEPCPWCVNDLVMAGETVREEMQNPQDNRWYYVVSAPIHRVDGRISKQAMVIDITERIEAEEEKEKLESQQRQLVKVESLDRMAGAIAHHFNNKLHVVIGQLEMALLDVEKQSQVGNHLSKALQAADQASEISRLMLTYLGKVSGRKDTLDLVENCRRSVSQLQNFIPANVSLIVEYETPGPVILGNSGHIQLIVANLVRNGWEAIGEQVGVVTLRVKNIPSNKISKKNRFPLQWQPTDGVYGCIEIEDTGCGIDAADIEAAFDPFFSTKFTGRGLGLSVVQGLVQAYNGVATVESELDKGSIFRVFFPVIEREVSSPLLPAVDTVPEFQSGGTVLLVDDDKIVLLITREMLEILGFKVITAQDGVEAIKLFEKQQEDICLVLSDFAMPKMNGLEMLTKLRAISPDLPVILASGYSEEQVMDISHPERPNAFLEKPFGAEDLREAIAISFTKIH